MTINFRDHIPHAKTAWCPLFWSFVGREAAHLRCEPDQTWQKSLVLPMLGTFTRSISPPPDSISPPPDSRIEYSDMIMHELEQMRTDFNNERQYRAAMQLESARMQESKFSPFSLGQIARPSDRHAHRPPNDRLAGPDLYGSQVGEREGERERA